MASTDLVKITPSVLGAERQDYHINVISGNPRFSRNIEFQNVDKTLIAGCWESDEGVLDVIDYPIDEICFLVGGALNITYADGSKLNLVVGDTFVIPKGFSGTWEMIGVTRKTFMGLVSSEMLLAMSEV